MGSSSTGENYIRAIKIIFHEDYVHMHKNLKGVTQAEEGIHVLIFCCVCTVDPSCCLVCSAVCCVSLKRNKQLKFFL